MTPAARARICAQCDKSVHDLSQYDLDEAEALLRGSPGICVRARIDAEGVVMVKPGRGGAARRMVIAVATAGLLGASVPALAAPDRPAGGIAGNVQSFGFRLRVTATGADGRTFRARVGNNGRFRIRNVPAGTYTLTFVPSCGESWTVENVVVEQGETVVADVENRGTCIIIGMVRIEDATG